MFLKIFISFLMLCTVLSAYTQADLKIRKEGSVRFGSVDAKIIAFGGDSTPECRLAISNNGRYFFLKKMNSTCTTSTNSNGLKIICNSDKTVCKTRQELLAAVQNKMTQTHNRSSLWTKTYGGNKDDKGYAVIQTKDGGFAIVGSTFSYGNGKTDIYVIRVDKNGNKIWEKTFGEQGYDSANSIVETKDGGFIIAGTLFDQSKTLFYLYFLKIDKNGHMVWERALGQKGINEAKEIIPTYDGNFIIAGDYEYAEHNDAYIIKIDSENGYKIVEGSYGIYSHANSITQSDEGYIIAGVYEGGHVYIVKIDRNGNKIWEKIIRKRNSKAEKIIATSNGNYIIVGWISQHAYILKIDRNGNKIWEKIYGNAREHIALRSITATQDGNFIIVGDNNAGGYILKINSNGNKIWEKTFKYKQFNGCDVISTTDGSVVIVGDTDDKLNDVFLMKMDIYGNIKY